MGLLTWFLASLAVALLTRWIPQGRRSLISEAACGVAAGLLAGALATWFDFGGWRELDWRSIAFVMGITMLAIAVVRLTGLVPPKDIRPPNY